MIASKIWTKYAVHDSRFQLKSARREIWCLIALHLMIETTYHFFDTFATKTKDEYFLRGVDFKQ